jgi:hypothetical protein
MEYIIQDDHVERGCDGVNWVKLAQNRPVSPRCGHGYCNLQFTARLPTNKLTATFRMLQMLSITLRYAEQQSKNRVVRCSAHAHSKVLSCSCYLTRLRMETACSYGG